MAQLKSQTFGVINGKVGNVVYRQVNGKTFASIRPSKYNVTNTEKSVKVKTGFKNLVKFSSFINSIPILKVVWSDRKILRGKRTYNKIFSWNKQFIKSDKITSLFDIVPNSKNRNIEIYNFIVTESYCNFLFKLSGKVEDYFNSSFISVIVIYDAKSDQFTSQMSEIITEETLIQYNVSIELTPENFKVFNSGENSILFHTLIQIDDSNNLIDWSESLGKENKVA